jgi:hypothetical protein
VKPNVSVTLDRANRQKYLERRNGYIVSVIFCGHDIYHTFWIHINVTFESQSFSGVLRSELPSVLVEIPGSV